MNLLKYLLASCAKVRVPRVLVLLLTVAFVASAVFPTDLESYPHERELLAPSEPYANGVEHYARFINTALQIGIPLLLWDREGLAQLAVIAVATTLATHGTKHLVNNLIVDSTRLGQRPSGPDSRYNIPSGHSSMAGSAVYFLARRYALAFLWITVPVLLMTMYARIALGAHTLSAVLAGACLGMLVAALFTSRWRPAVLPAGAAQA